MGRALADPPVMVWSVRSTNTVENNHTNMNKIMHTTTKLLVLALLGGSTCFASATETNTVLPKMPVLAKGILLPEFKLDAVPFLEAVNQLHAVSRQHDPANQGINCLVTDTAETHVYPKITLDLKNVTVGEAAERLAQSAGDFVTAQDYALVFRPKKDLGAVELVAVKPAQFSLGEGKCCTIVGRPTYSMMGRPMPDVLHLKLRILSTNTEGTVYIQSLGEATTMPGKRVDIALGDTMVSIIPTLKMP